MTNKFQPLVGALLLFSALVFTSCGSDSEDEPPVNIDHITSAVWTFEEVVDAADANSSIGLSFFAPATLSFSDDNTFVASTLDGEFEGTWSFAENVLTFEDEENPTTFEVRELNASRLLLYFNGPVFDPNTEQTFELDGALLYVAGQE